MKQEQLNSLPPGVYRLYWKSGGYSVASVGRTTEGLYWFAPSNWVYEPSERYLGYMPSFNWEMVERIEIIEVVGNAMKARTACDVVNAWGKTEHCCECGEEYPRADLMRGHVFCPNCRPKETGG